MFLFLFFYHTQSAYRHLMMITYTNIDKRTIMKYVLKYFLNYFFFFSSVFPWCAFLIVRDELNVMLNYKFKAQVNAYPILYTFNIWKEKYKEQVFIIIIIGCIHRNFLNAYCKHRLIWLYYIVLRLDEIDDDWSGAIVLFFFFEIKVWYLYELEWWQSRILRCEIPFLHY